MIPSHKPYILSVAPIIQRVDMRQEPGIGFFIPCDKQVMNLNHALGTGVGGVGASNNKNAAQKADEYLHVDWFLLMRAERSSAEAYHG